jgi:cell division septation protein DedD
MSDQKARKVPTPQIRRPHTGSTLIGFLLGIGFSLVVAAIVAYFVYSKESPFKNEKGANPPTASLPQPKVASTSASGTITPPGGAPAPVAKSAPVVEPPTTPVAAPVAAPPPANVAADLAKPEPVSLPAPKSEPSEKKAKEKEKENKPLFLQAGAFSNKDEAENRRAQLALVGIEGKITEIMKDEKPIFRVRVGPFDSPESASKARGDMARNGIDSVLIK